MSRLTRDGMAEPVSRDQILRHARGQGNVIFPVQLTTSRIGNLTRLIHTMLYVTTIHTYIDALVHAVVLAPDVNVMILSQRLSSPLRFHCLLAFSGTPGAWQLFPTNAIGGARWPGDFEERSTYAVQVCGFRVS